MADQNKENAECSPQAEDKVAESIPEESTGAEGASGDAQGDDGPAGRGVGRGGRGSRGRGGPAFKPSGSIYTRVYVGNLAYSTSWQDLKDHMRQVGEVTFAKVIEDDQGRSKGCGIVEFALEEDALKAIETLSDTTIKDTERPIFVREDRVDSYESSRARGRSRARGGRGRGRGRAGPMVDGPKAGRQVFVGNLPYSTSWQDLKDIFVEIGPILRADVLFGPDGRPKGHGTVCFENEGDAKKAIEQMNDHVVEGRKIHVSQDKYAQ